jgi:branched-chain amino acid transport system substrate-binding protein
MSGQRLGSVRRHARAIAVTAVLLGAATACSGDDGDEASGAATSAETSAVESTSAETTAAATEGEQTTTSAAASDTTAAATDDGDAYTAFVDLAAPTGAPMSVGLVNTEGTPGLDFPDIRLAIAGTVDYLNEHGGIGGRPIELVTCTANGSPETSQACAQELTGKGVELVLVGLDLFPDYATYTAADVPVIGMLPILPGDYSADALFLTGGNATTMAAAAVVTRDHFQAETVGIISADNPGANASLSALTASLDKAGVRWTSVKGGDNETDAGYQGLMREAASDDPDVLISLYSDAGCIGTMRGRASLGIEIPVITTAICSSTDVIEQVGDDASGWTFIGVATQESGPSLELLQTVMAPVLEVEPAEVDSTSLGLGGLGFVMMMSVAVYGNEVEAGGAEVTGRSVHDLLATSDGLFTWPGTTPIDCGAAPAYPAVCAFTFPFAEYTDDAEVRTVAGLEAVSALELLP